MEIGKPKYSTVVDPKCIPFGKHKGELITDVPTKYLEWLEQQDWVLEKFTDLMHEVEIELLTREAQEEENSRPFPSHWEDELDNEFGHQFHEDVYDND